MAERTARIRWEACSPIWTRSAAQALNADIPRSSRFSAQWDFGDPKTSGDLGAHHPGAMALVRQPNQRLSAKKWYCGDVWHVPKGRDPEAASAFRPRAHFSALGPRTIPVRSAVITVSDRSRSDDLKIASPACKRNSCANLRRGI